MSRKFIKEDLYKDQKYISWVLNARNRNAYNKEFKKHDYYGLEFLKKHHLKEYIHRPPYEEPVRFKKTPSD